MASPVDSTITEVGGRALLGSTGTPSIQEDSSTQTTMETIQASVSSGNAKEEAQVPRYSNLHALLASLKLPDGLTEKFSTDKEQPVNFVVVGKYQVGKSALINSMFYKKAQGFKEIAIEGDMEPTTDVIECHGPCEVHGIEFHIYDTMGLQDGRRKDKAHVSKIKEIFTTAHLIIYCTKLQEPIRPDDVSTLKSLTKACGKSFWKNAVIALTFANAAAPNDPEKQNWFGDLLQRKKEKLHKCFVEDLGISEEVWGTLSQHTVAVGNHSTP
ncbi:Translocase of chloroplast 34 homolog, chloroplastic [Geodia barretti]|uniref:Translocase of chloroplast 34 homolog, chloroplastic n=1 Tax=Geodia barretti TaxID=519541 RepID=A0AA35RUD8_GEOBA|nr:Translocase of chloroplast 34 homolog, chloroplastic [Geodia barretti]